MNTIEKALQKQQQGKGSETPDAGSDVRRVGASAGTGVTKNSVEIDLQMLETAGMLTPDNGRSRIAEEMRAIKRPLLKNAFGKTAQQIEHGNLIMVTSALPGEGKSFNSINLAISIAMELDRTVLLVDADVARPSIMRYLNLHADKGLVDYLLDEKMPLSDVLLKTNIPELNILPAGRQHTHATELLASDSMHRLTRELSERYPDRVVIFDSPPLLATSESRVLAGLMGQVLVVVESVRTTEAVVKEALSFLNPQHQTIGLVLNKLRGKSASAYYGGYGYGYGYGQEPENKDA